MKNPLSPFLPCPLLPCEPISQPRMKQPCLVRGVGGGEYVALFDEIGMSRNTRLIAKVKY
ncbi:MAG TPA: hypothetical protein DDW51_05885 [Cyanobacteria bacterium UBA11367]|nr:hypothetical protein [Cyanobacteria bacterium UBA11367]HBK66801.1 hypothetical protein [Cyanobacteria bacterium UBA11166]HBS70445.1 hypothetical protein [Cyanobacteria bacterium UBA11153]